MTFADFVQQEETKQKETKIIFSDNSRYIKKWLERVNKSGQPTSKIINVELVDFWKPIYIASCVMKGHTPFEIIANDEMVYYFDALIASQDESFVIPKESRGILTSKKIYSDINTYRMAKKQVNKQECDDIVSLLETSLKGNNQMDYPMLLNDVKHIIDESSRDELLEYANIEVNTSIGVFDAKLSFLERELITSFAKKLNIDINVIELAESGSERPHENFVKSYGYYNEVSFAARTILEKGYRFGDVAIYYTSSEYENLIAGEFEGKNVPVSFTDARNAMSSEVFQIANKLIEWKQKKDEPKTRAWIENSQIFANLPKLYNPDNDKAIQDKYDEEKKVYDTDWMELFVEDRDLVGNYKSLVAFINKYLHKISNETIQYYGVLKNQIRKVVFMEQPGEIISLDKQLEIIKKMLTSVSVSDNEEQNSVKVRSLSNIDLLDRKYVFILGLTAKQLIKKEAESPLINDEEMVTMLDSGAGYVRISQNASKEYREMLEDMADNKIGGEIYYIYSYYDTVNLRKTAPSPFYNARKKSSDAIPVNYTGTIWGVSRADAKWDEIDFTGNPDEWMSTTKLEDSEKEYKDYVKVNRKGKEESATSLKNLLECPLSYYYSKIRGIRTPNNIEFHAEKTLEANEKGLIFHKICQDYCDKVFIHTNSTDVEYKGREFVENTVKEVMTNPEFQFTCSKGFEKIREYEIKKITDVVEVYLKGVHSGYAELNSQGKALKVLGCELEFGEKKAGIPVSMELSYNKMSVEIPLNGSIDRLEGYIKDGQLRLRIIDYKSGKYSNVETHIEDENMVQHYVYALGALCYVERQKDYIEKNFFDGQKIESAIVENMTYVFPFEQSDKQSISFDAVEIANWFVSNALANESELEGINLLGQPLKNVPENARKILCEVLGNLYKGNVNEAIGLMDFYAGELLYKSGVGKGYDGCSPYCEYKAICHKNYIDGEIYDRIVIFSKLKSEVDKLEKELINAKDNESEDIKKASAELEKKHAAVVKAESALEDSKKEVEKKEAAIKEKEDALVKKQKELDEKKAEGKKTATLEKNVESGEKAVAKAKETYKKAQEMVTKNEGKLTKAQEEEAEALKKYKTAKNKVQDMGTEICKKKADLAEAEAEAKKRILHEIKESGKGAKAK